MIRTESCSIGPVSFNVSSLFLVVFEVDYDLNLYVHIFLVDSYHMNLHTSHISVSNTTRNTNGMHYLEMLFLFISKAFLHGCKFLM